MTPVHNLLLPPDENPAAGGAAEEGGPHPTQPYSGQGRTVPTVQLQVGLLLRACVKRILLYEAPISLETGKELYDVKRSVTAGR